MAYSKSDFFHWDRDIDLDVILGECTNSEFEIDFSDEEVVPVPSTSAKKWKTENTEVVTGDANKPPTSAKKRKTESTDKQCKCSECESYYSPVTGIRGHVQKKHGISRVRGKYQQFI